MKANVNTNFFSTWVWNLSHVSPDPPPQTSRLYMGCTVSLCPFWAQKEEREATGYPSAIHHTPVWKLNLHNSFWEACHCSVLPLSHFSVGADILLILHQAGPPAENQIGKGNASHCREGWEMYYLNTIYFTAMFKKMRSTIALEEEAFGCIWHLCICWFSRRCIVLKCFQSSGCFVFFHTLFFLSTFNAYIFSLIKIF